MHLRGAALLFVLGAVCAPAHAEFEQQLGPLAGTVRQQLLQGWTAGVQDGWFSLQNKGTPGSEQTLYVNVGPAPDAGRITDVNVVVSSQNPKASIGVVLNNRPRKSLCLLEISADKNTQLFCLEGQNRRDFGSMPNVAKLDGSDRIKVVEVPGAARFIVNGQKIGDVADVPALGGDIGIMAYDVGTFGVADFAITTNKGTPQAAANPPPAAGLPPRTGLPPRGGGTGANPQNPQPPAAPPQSAPAQGSNNSGLQGAGPYPRFGGDTERIVAVYIGLMKSIFMHEFGHALIGELELPSTGAEEDAVDIYAALQIVEPTMYPSGNKDVDRMAREAATYAALQWYYSGKLSEGKGQAPSAWQDEHTGDLKRFRNMLCIMYGGNPEVFESVVRQTGFEDRTKARCTDEFNKQNRAWRKILAPHTRVGTWTPDGLQPANAPGAPVNVVFEPSTRKIGNLFAKHLSDAISENIKLLGKTYVLPRPVNVVFKDCGKLNAWYSPREGSITMCYELIENIAVMISDIEMGTVGGEVVAKDGSAPPPRQQAPAGQSQGQGQGQGAAAPTGAFDELKDSGVPATTLLFTAPYKGPTPIQHYRAKVITTKELVPLITNNKNIVIVDTSGLRDTLPIAYPLADAGSDGSVKDHLQSALDDWLLKKAGGNRGVPIVLMGASMNDRSSYNAALRVGTLGWDAYWYRGGMEAWVANGLPTVPVKPAQN
jgi:rhodanese-related sulfurtransferase